MLCIYIYIWVSLCWQLLVRVRDSGTPYRFNTTTLKVVVNRNFQDPQFEQNRYTRNIDESWTIGTSVVQVLAQDQDRRVRHTCQSVLVIWRSLNFKT